MSRVAPHVLALALKKARLQQVAERFPRRAF